MENAKHEHWRTDERLDPGSDQVGLTLCMGKCKSDLHFVWVNVSWTGGPRIEIVSQ